MNNGRLLGIDFGKKRVGIAISDPLNIFAYGLKALDNDENLYNEIKKIVEEYDIYKIIVGYPLKENGSFTDITKDTLAFVERLKKEIKAEVELWDEVYSSKIAVQKAVEIGMKKSKRRDKKEIDKLAAQTILSDYMEYAKWKKTNE